MGFDLNVLQELTKDAQTGSSTDVLAGRALEKLLDGKEVSAFEKEKIYFALGEKLDAEVKVKYSLKDTEIPTAETLAKKKDVEVINISEPQTTGNPAQRRKQILENAKEVIKKPYLNKDTGVMIFLTSKSYTHTFSNSGELQLNIAEHLPEIEESPIGSVGPELEKVTRPNPQGLSSIKVTDLAELVNEKNKKILPKLVENAVLTNAEKPTYGSEDTDKVYRFLAAVKGEEVKPVKLTVKEYNVNGQPLPQNIKEYFSERPKEYSSLYDAVILKVDKIEESPIGSVEYKTEKASPLDPQGLSSIKVTDLAELVNEKNKKILPKKEDLKEKGDNAEKNNPENEKTFEDTRPEEQRKRSEAAKDFGNVKKTVAGDGYILYDGTNVDMTKKVYHHR